MHRKEGQSLHIPVEEAKEEEEEEDAEQLAIFEKQLEMQYQKKVQEL